MSTVAIPIVSTTRNLDSNATANTGVLRDNSGGVTHNAATINGNITTQTVNKAVKSVSTSQTMDSSATYWHTTGAITLTLPLVSAVAAGREYVIFKTDGTTTLTINTSDSTTINGASTLTATTQYTKKTIWTDGVNWCAA